MCKPPCSAKSYKRRSRLLSHLAFKMAIKTRVALASVVTWCLLELASFFLKKKKKSISSALPHLKYPKHVCMCVLNKLEF